MSDDRSHEATPQRRAEALARGEAPATPEIAGVLAALAVGALARQLPISLSHGFAKLATPLWSPDTFSALARGTLDLAALRPPDALPPGFGILAIVPVAVALSLLIQKGFAFLPGRLAPDPSRLAPRIPGADSGEFADAFARGAARLGLGFYAGFRLCAASPAAWTLSEAGLRCAALFREIAALWLAFAALDWLLRRHRFEQALMMTPAEVRAEARASDGDPRVKGELRARMEAKLTGAGPSRRVLLTEGDAVALVTIFQDKTRVPQVLVGARGVQAQRLLAGSDRLAVPVVAAPGAARLAGARPGSAIPEELYGAVAPLHARVFAGGEAA